MQSRNWIDRQWSPCICLNETRSSSFLYPQEVQKRSRFYILEFLRDYALEPVANLVEMPTFNSFCWGDKFVVKTRKRFKSSPGTVLGGNPIVFICCRLRVRIKDLRDGKERVVYVCRDHIFIFLFFRNLSGRNVGHIYLENHIIYSEFWKFDYSLKFEFV